MHYLAVAELLALLLGREVLLQLVTKELEELIRVAVGLQGRQRVLEGW